MNKRTGNTGLLKQGLEESRWQRVARYRLGSELRGGRYWEGEEKRVCSCVKVRRKHGNTNGKDVENGKEEGREAARKQYSGCPEKKGRKSGG